LVSGLYRESAQNLRMGLEIASEPLDLVGFAFRKDFSASDSLVCRQ